MPNNCTIHKRAVAIFFSVILYRCLFLINVVVTSFRIECEFFLHRIIKGSERDIFLLKNMLLREFYSFFTSVDLNGACIRCILNEEKVSRESM